MSPPVSTYRLQFNAQFTFEAARDILDYLQELGISHCYASPFLKAKSQSSHGYDITDHSQINPEIGSLDQFISLVDGLRQRGMGLICDIVPNHMYIRDSANHWWFDVLENGPSSPYADYFDIDWQPPRQELTNKVLLPVLEDQYGIMLESKALQVTYKDGCFLLQLPGMVLPTDPKSWELILQPLSKGLSLENNDLQLLELKSIATALAHLPETSDRDPEKVVERLREKDIIKRRLNDLTKRSQEIAQAIEMALTTLNHNFDALESFLNRQAYRLCFWRVANDEINYRRFFDIFDLAGIRTENEEVFNAIHSLIFDWVNQQYIDGLRIDHIDGLWDPELYLEKLNQATKNTCYVIVEKILTGEEKLLSDWKTCGTVGYDFLNRVNGIFVAQQNRKALNEIYRNFTGCSGNTFELIYTCKKTILHVSMSSELYVIARQLDHISEQHRNSRDFTEESLRSALRDVIACFPVYRSYIRAPKHEIHSTDKEYIVKAINRAKRHNPAINASIFEFIQSVLLLDHPPGLSDEQIVKREDFVMRFQQLTGPVMAKGVEDTACYRYYPLCSLNEVGSDPYSFGTSPESFHKINQERTTSWPHTMLTTSTHDTKRSEDVRARINVLSEMPEEWEKTLQRWSEMNAKHKFQEDDDSSPDRNEEYLLYQTLLGTWPLYPMDPGTHLQYIKRIQAYMEKAVKEAKLNSSWINPNKKHDNAVCTFIENILTSHTYLTDFSQFVKPIQKAGMLSSLCQLVLKLTCPGIPDIYQGNEVWDFSLVDPDNRRSIDYQNRKFLLKSLKNNSLSSLLNHPEDGQIKLFVTQTLLQLRLHNQNLFSSSSYLPLDTPNQLLAFARTSGNQALVVIIRRFFLGPQDWHGIELQMPFSGRFKNVFSGASVESFCLEELLSTAPFVVLEGQMA